MSTFEITHTRTLSICVERENENSIVDGKIPKQKKKLNYKRKPRNCIKISAIHKVGSSCEKSLYDIYTHTSTQFYTFIWVGAYKTRFSHIHYETGWIYSLCDSRESPDTRNILRNKICYSLSLSFITRRTKTTLYKCVCVCAWNSEWRDCESVCVCGEREIPTARDSVEK